MALLQAKIDTGIVEGIPGWNQAVTIFRGIPYGAPPVGDLRWKAPQPVEPWEGVRQCYKFGNISYQERRPSEGGDDIIGREFYCLDWPRDEDCLYLNVWTPAKSADEKLPVGVYFHGGGWGQGYGHLNCYDGEGFAKRGIITVTINHRLGIFGFLAHEELQAEDTENHSTGNYGVMDLIAALKWVKRNIAAFGGDPDQVTIFGQSGGGSKVATMLASPLSQGLISGAIMQSGGGISRSMSEGGLADAIKLSKDVLAAGGYHNIAEARQASQEDLLEACRKYTESMKHDGFLPLGAPMIRFGPVVDGYVFPESTAAIFCSGKFQDVPVMCGSTESEFVKPDAQLPDRETALAQMANQFGKDHAEEALAAIKFDDEDKSTALDYYRRLSLMTGGMFSGALAFARNQSKIGHKPAYHYYITLTPPGAANAHHSVEHQFVFQTLLKSSRPYTGKDYDLSNQMANYWANFIKTGDPNGDGNPEWTPYTPECPKAMNIDYDLKMIDEPVTPITEMMVKKNLGEL